MVAREQQVRLRAARRPCGWRYGPGVVTASMVQPCAGDDLAVGERAVGPELGIVAGIEPRRLADIERTRGAVRPFGKHQRTGRRLDAAAPPANDRGGCG